LESIIQRIWKKIEFYKNLSFRVRWERREDKSGDRIYAKNICDEKTIEVGGLFAFG
jgi:hypothetical protein